MVSTSYIRGAISEPFQVTMQIWAVLAARLLMLCTRQAGLAIVLVVQQRPSTQLLVRKFSIYIMELFHIRFASYGNSNPQYCVWITTEVWSVTGWVLFTKYYSTTTLSEIRTQRFNSSNTLVHHWRQFFPYSYILRIVIGFCSVHFPGFPTKLLYAFVPYFSYISISYCLDFKGLIVLVYCKKYIF